MSALCYCGAPATTGSLCTDDLARLQSNLHRTPDVLRDLDVTITKQDAQGGGGGSSEPAMVFNERASDARINLTYLLRSAARTADPTIRTETPGQDAAVALSRIGVIARAPGAHTVAQDLHDALHEAQHVRERGPERVSYGPCVCGMEITAPTFARTAKCRGCGGEHDLAGVQAWRITRARDAAHDYRGKLADVVRILNIAGYGLKLNTVCKWVERDKLSPADDGLFMARDVLNVSQKSLT